MDPIIDEESSISGISSNILQNKYFLVAVLLALAGGVYGVTHAFKSLEVNFTLYCGSVWFVCLALIFLANYTAPPSMSKLTSSSSIASDGL